MVTESNKFLMGFKFECPSTSKASHSSTINEFSFKQNGEGPPTYSFETTRGLGGLSGIGSKHRT